MTDETTKTGPDATATDNPAGFAQEDAETVDTAQPSQPDPVELLKAENSDLRDRYLRLAAEMDNLRRRTERDVKDAKSYSVASFARDMLAVSDNLRRTLEAIPAEARAEADAGQPSGSDAGQTKGAPDAGTTRGTSGGCGCGPSGVDLAQPSVIVLVRLPNVSV